MHAFAVGDLPDAYRDVFLSVQDRMVAPVGASELSLGVGADRADDGRAQRAQPLTRDEAHAAGRSVQQNDITLADREGPPHEILHRASLEHDPV